MGPTNKRTVQVTNTIQYSNKIVRRTSVLSFRWQ